MSHQHEESPAPRRPPAETGRRLAAFPRGDGREELRVTLDKFKGRDYVSLRLWTRDGSGWWPSKRGMSVRISETSGVAQALRLAAELATELAEPRAPTRSRR